MRARKLPPLVAVLAVLGALTGGAPATGQNPPASPTPRVF